MTVPIDTHACMLRRIQEDQARKLATDLKELVVPNQSPAVHDPILPKKLSSLEQRVADLERRTMSANATLVSRIEEVS